MCLRTIDIEIKQAEEGWKVFEEYNGKLYSVYKNYEFTTKKWVKDENSMYLFSEDTERLDRRTMLRKYISGFHFYYNKKDAIYLKKIFPKLVVKKIKVRNIVASGIEGISSEVGVAKEIYIK